MSEDEGRITRITCSEPRGLASYSLPSPLRGYPDAISLLPAGLPHLFPIGIFYYDFNSDALQIVKTRPRQPTRTLLSGRSQTDKRGWHARLFHSDWTGRAYLARERTALRGFLYQTGLKSCQCFHDIPVMFCSFRQLEQSRVV